MQVENVEIVGGGIIKPIPIQVANAYWRYRYRKGNLLAGAIIDACQTESIERRADAAFGVNRTEAEHQQRFASNLTDEAIAQQQLLDKQMEYAEKANRIRTSTARI